MRWDGVSRTWLPIPSPCPLPLGERVIEETVHPRCSTASLARVQRMAAHGMVTWTELNTRDVARAKAFYAATLGWTFSSMPVNGAEYTLIHSEAQPVMAGILDMNGLPGMKGMPEHWFTHIAVEYVDARAAKVLAAGGTFIRPPFDVPGVGRIDALQKRLIRSPAWNWVSCR
jgi:uncharacterized protein